MMGFNFGLNFNMPYFAKNPRDFWRRWHISLSSWLKDYLYISLGGSRGSEFKTYRNLIATMVLGGLWHGAAWNFVLWGSYHGLLLSIHRFMTNRFFSAQKNYQNLNRPLALAKTSISVFVMFMFTLYGWLLFRANSFEQIENMTMSLINIDFNDYLFTNLTRLGFYCWPLIMIEVIQMYKKDLTVYFKAPATIQSAGYMVLTLMIIILGNFDGTSFIYFQF
jgi:D-alanyl-lipoteichoic acid acyltransferase DltB (MBOAT superfamily)